MNKTSFDSEGNIIKIENGSFRWSNSIDDPLILQKFVEKIKYPLKNTSFLVLVLILKFIRVHLLLLLEQLAQVKVVY